MNMPPKLPAFGRIKPKYNPIPNAAEKRHERFVKEQPCFGCGVYGRSEAHHTLLPVEGKRWRRDHRLRVPVCHDCHKGPQGIHGIGSEREWCRINQKDTAAEAKRLERISVTEGRLP